MSGLKILTICLLLQFTYSAQANAESWKRTDKNAKIVAKASLQLEAKILKIKSLPEEKVDHVAKKDAINEKLTDTEIKLQEALEVLLYWAYQSPNQKRYLKRVAKNVTASQLKQIKRILKTLEDNESWMTDEYAVDYIEKQAEKWAGNDVLTAQQNIRNKTQNIAQNSK